jgi:4-diphosphocytidyl-2-C-methyl-D-erythritol kinase
MYAKKIYQGLKFPKSQPDTAARLTSKPGRTNLLTKIHDNANILIRNLKKDNVLEVSSFIENDLESPVIRLHPPLQKLQKRLKALGAKGVMVSGSGPCIFGLTTTEAQAKQIQSILSKRYSQVFVAQTF